MFIVQNYPQKKEILYQHFFATLLEIRLRFGATRRQLSLKAHFNFISPLFVLIFRAKTQITVKFKQAAVLDACKRVGLDVNADKPSYKLMPRHHNAGQDHNVRCGS